VNGYPVRSTSGAGAMARPQSDSLADVLERVLDKGIVIAGDIVVNVLDIELLTLKLRLYVSSAETAREMGMDWWTSDPFFTGGKQAVEADEGRDAVGSGQDDTELATLRDRVRELEQLVRSSGLELDGARSGQGSGSGGRKS